MAFPTGEVTVRTKELEAAHGVVIEAHVRRPALWRVTLITRLVELALVEIVMAVAARGINRAKMPLLVTRRAFQFFVLTLEFEAAQAVIEETDLPVLESTVASITPNISELASMEI